MKYKSEKTLRRAKKAFSLIELMIVIVIIGALTAIILPQFDISEAEAKDTACDTSNYGTLRQLASFRSVNGVYPMGLHTGLETTTTNAEMGSSSGTGVTQALPNYTNVNISSLAKALSCSIGSDDSAYATSLATAGIAYVASGGYPKSSDNVEDAAFALTKPTKSLFIAMLEDEDDKWYEENAEYDSTADTGEEFTGEAPLTINGVPLGFYAYSNAHLAASQYDPDDTSGSDNSNASISAEKNGAVVALFVTPNVDWDNYYNEDGEVEGTSRLSVAQVGGCPWLEGGADFRYYIAFFKVFADGSPAKLLGTSCPEGGSLNP